MGTVWFAAYSVYGPADGTGRLSVITAGAMADVVLAGRVTLADVMKLAVAVELPEKSCTVIEPAAEPAGRYTVTFWIVTAAVVVK